jgi:hypothetical protein
MSPIKNAFVVDVKNKVAAAYWVGIVRKPNLL